MPYQANKSDSQSINVEKRNRDNIELAKKAADNDELSRKKVNDLVAPIINYQAARFCKRFCKENRSQFKCTLKDPVGNPAADASLCEWGNGSYAWMLNDLSNSRRLKNYQARNNATLFDYCFVIANSLPFYERWKDWRFNRKIYVPAYIQALGKDAAAVFYALQSQQTIDMISQQIQQPVKQTREISRIIIKLLAQRNKLHLLNPKQNISLNQSDDGTEESTRTSPAVEAEIATYDTNIEKHEDNILLSEAWRKLNTIEQFVIEALVIEEQDAEIVLTSLKKLNLSFKEGVAAEMLDRQQLYYFRRKTLAKLYALINK